LIDYQFLTTFLIFIPFRFCNFFDFFRISFSTQLAWQLFSYFRVILFLPPTVSQSDRWLIRNSNVIKLLSSEFLGTM